MNSEIIKVPYVDIAGQHAPLKKELLAAIERVIDHGIFVLGPEVEEFEAQFAELCGTDYAVGVNSGTDALILGLRALGIGSGDEVITAPNSFVASASCISLVGAVPVFADVGDDYNLDPKLVESAITPRTKAILPVHLTGRSARMAPLVDLARDKNLFILEDAAQAVLAEYRGQKVGSFGDVGCFSCHPLKTLNAMGDAGVVTTNDLEVAKRLRILRNIGLESRDNSVVWAGNSRLDAVQAAVLQVKLRFVQEWTDRRRANAKFYQTELAFLGQYGLRVPDERDDERAVYHTFVVRAERREKLRKYLSDNGIGTAIHYPVPIHLQDAASHLNCPIGSFPEAERQAGEILSLPVYPELSEEQLTHVVQTIKEFYNR
ncbi:DegT/DnrJ/EryC1/StrS family aminotransferase [SAR202 cluster bacterium AD-804-J14_MRT_500m]|nr:DegT/DnrJ/EryC1/StrS family aminotransferase [SAR202 cluster bacterium AD-804-J14_MRT_500m]